MFEGFLKNVPLFSQLNDVQIQRISQICTKKSFQAGTVLFKEKEMGSVFYIVFSGSVKIYTSQGGDEKVLALISQGESFGELSLIDGKPRSASAQTVENCILIALSAIEFLEMLKHNFDISLCIMQELSQRLRDTNQHVHDLTFLDARSRVLKNLINMANKKGTRTGTQISIRMSLNYDELSRMAGVQKNVLMEVLRDLQAKGILMISANDFTLELTKLRG